MRSFFVIFWGYGDCCAFKAVCWNPHRGDPLQYGAPWSAGPYRCYSNFSAGKLGKTRFNRSFRLSQVRCSFSARIYLAFPFGFQSVRTPTNLHPHTSHTRKVATVRQRSRPYHNPRSQYSMLSTPAARRSRAPRRALSLSPRVTRSWCEIDASSRVCPFPYVPCSNSRGRAE